MTFGPGAYGLGVVSGALSTLSPCVLPILPIIIGSAASAHRQAPMALAAGLAISYATTGSVLAWAASSLGLDTAPFRIAAALLLGALGIVLLSGTAQRRFAAVTAGLAAAGQGGLARLRLDGLRGQFVVGLLLGVVWSPCVGPTLGAAIALASRGSNLPEVASVMAAFGVGAALPVLVLAQVSRAGFARSRQWLLGAGQAGKTVLGAALVAVAAFVLLGLDKRAEAWLVDRSPAWLTTLTTRF